MPDNIERLRKEGFTVNTPMPEEYERVLRELSNAEMETLISVTRRLDEARVARGAEKDDWTNYFLPP
jgi:hypothetical protein